MVERPAGLPELTAADLSYLRGLGISAEEAAAQLAQLTRPPAATRLARPCTVGGGIVQLGAAELLDAIHHGDAAAALGRVMKFVPASGAATRMFKDLISALQGPRIPSATPAAREFFARLDEFPFAEELLKQAGLDASPVGEQQERHLLQTLLVDMRLAEAPKALVPFHRIDRPRTAFEEHLLEATRYTRDSSGVCRMNFTVSAEGRSQFESALAALQPVVQTQRRGTRLDVTLSEQCPSTQTLALDDTGQPFRNSDGTLLLRPSGHGALLRNLQESGGDLVVIKNIDNVLPDEASAEVVRWKRILIGYLSVIEADVFRHLETVSASNCSLEAMTAARTFALDRFARVVPEHADPDELRRAIVRALNRPLRVCGVVRNQGEPGGAPFWIRALDGCETIQIVEPAQVDMDDPDQAHIFHAATHFNPVDVVCSLRAFDGTSHDLEQFVAPDTAFVTRKTADGRALLALERPGLWNGSMAGWNTICVDVPASTFAPVKTIFDLLRPQHQFKRPRRQGADTTAAITGTVLIIDDQLINQRLLSRILEQGGIQTLVAEDGERGLELAKRARVDLVLLDIVLPGLDGYEVLSQMLAAPETRDIPVILISSLDAVADKVRGMELGAADYVAKPFDPQEVLARVRAQLRIRTLAASLSRAHEQLLLREELLLEDLRAAADVQKSLLPRTNLQTEHLVSGYLFEPSLAIGGDIFNVAELADGSILTFMADVSGHGVASALLTMSLAQWLSSVPGLRRPGPFPGPASILEALEEEYQFERFGKYFSIVIATIDPATGAVLYSAAGHPPPLVVRASGDVERLDSGGPVVGMGFGLPFEEGRAVLQTGDRIVFYTDGVVEDLSVEGVRFGTDRLLDTFVHARHLPLSEVCASLGARLRSRRGDAPAADDIALLVFERH